MTTTLLTTADQLLQMPGLGRCELVQGELIMMSPAGFRHGVLAARIAGALRAHVEAQGLGWVAGAETGFHIARDPDTVRAPDAAFVCARRVPENLPAGFLSGAPDLAVEVLSPDDRAGEVAAKVQAWLAAGSQAVWVIDPRTRSVTVYRGLKEIVTLTGNDVLEGGDVLPGFALPLADLFAGLPPAPRV